MTKKKLPTILLKIHAYCTNFIAQLFQKTKKTGVPVLHNPPHFPATPPSTKKILRIQCVQEKIPYNRMKKLSF